MLAWSDHVRRWEERNWAIRAKPFREALEGRESAEWVFSAASDGKGRFIAATQIHPFGWIAGGEFTVGDGCHIHALDNDIIILLGQ